VSLESELLQIAAAAAGFAGPGEQVVAVIPAEPATGRRVYLCAFAVGDTPRSWLALDADGDAIDERRLVREAVAIAGLCEAAEESAAGGKVSELRERLAELRRTEQADVAEAEAAVVELERVLGSPPRLATPAYLDQIGAAARALEQALGHSAQSPFAQAMRGAAATVEGLELDVEGAYRVPLR
jgi:hypothetical protein